MLAVVSKDCIVGTEHPLLRKGLWGDSLLILVVTCPPLGSLSWLWGRTPLLFFGQAKKGRRNPVSFPARERKKEKGRENSLVSEGKRRKET